MNIYKNKNLFKENIKIISCTVGILFYCTVLQSQIYNYNFERLEMPHADSINVYKGAFIFEINPQLKTISMAKKYEVEYKLRPEYEKMTFRKKKDTIINHENYSLYFIKEDSEMSYQADLEYKIAISKNKLYYFNEYNFTSYSILIENLPQSYMLKENIELVKMGRKPSSYHYTKDSPIIRTKEQVISEENNRTQLEKELGCDKIYSAHLGNAIENLGIFLTEYENPKKQEHENWIKREFELLKSKGVLVVDCDHILGTDFQLNNNNGYKSITWIDSITRASFYSNNAFKELDYDGDSYYGGYSTYDFHEGSQTPNYNLNWQLIKSNESQSIRVFRNCYFSYIIEIKKMEDNLHLSLTLSKIPENMRTQSGYFMDCKKISEQILYKTNHWADIKGKGDFVKAMEEPIMEKVEILKTNKEIKVTFGTKVYNYIIVSENKFSAVKTEYVATLNGRKYTLNIMDYNKSAVPNPRNKGLYSINIEGVWMVPDIKDVSIKYGE